MMTWNRRGCGWHGHTTGALIVTSLVVWVLLRKDYLSFDILEGLMIILIGIIWGLMPDIDQRNSKIHQAFILVSAGTVIFAIVYDWVLVAIVVAVLVIGSQLLHHRGFMHSLKAAIIFSSPLLFLHWTYATVGLAAYLSHLLLDGKLHIISHPWRH